MKTIRGFEVQHFEDDYGADCSIQESSAVEPHIWLGVHTPEIQIMTKDYLEYNNVLSQATFIPDDTENPNVGWHTLQLPEQFYISGRMHLNRKQAKELTKKLNFFAKNGYLMPDDSV